MVRELKQKLQQETMRNLRKFVDLDEHPKVVYSDNALEFGKACESTPDRSETNGIAERAVRRVKEGLRPVSCSPDSMNNGGRI